MTVIINDLSLAGQYPVPEAFIDHLRALLALRSRNEILRQRLVCSRSLGDRLVTSDQSFRHVVMNKMGADARKLVLAWIDKSGPFWEDDQQVCDDNIFYFGLEDVTEQGLGEAARRKIAGREAISYGFRGSRPDCDAPVLNIDQGFPGSVISTTSIDNFVDPELLDIALISTVTSNNWRQFVDEIKVRYRRLVFASTIIKNLESYPFSSTSATRLKNLLAILERYCMSLDGRGEHTSETEHLINQYFRGNNAIFSDESSTNKTKYRDRLIFFDESTGENVFAPWHGKIRNLYFRIHFSWPDAKIKGKIRIHYIGPKLTKS